MCTLKGIGLHSIAWSWPLVFFRSLQSFEGSLVFVSGPWNHFEHQQL